MAELRLAVLQVVGLELHHDQPEERAGSKERQPPA